MSAKTEIFFETPDFNDSNANEKDLIRFYPYGLSLTTDLNRPFLLLRDDSREITLPVAVSPIEAGATLSQTAKAAGMISSPHQFTELLLSRLNIRIDKCVFVEIKGHSQYVKLIVKGETLYSEPEEFKLRAEEAMSLCVFHKIPIYATRAFAMSSRVMHAEVDANEKTMFMGRQMVDRATNYLM